MKAILTTSALLLASLGFNAQAEFNAAAPENLKATANSVIVDLSWDWGNLGAQTLFQDFEGTEFPPEGFVAGEYNQEECTWIPYTFEEDGELHLAHSGTGTMILMMGVDQADNKQNESMYVQPGEGAVYMDFWYYLDPILLEYGAYESFPDHYLVEISRDNGETWTELWDGRWDIGDVQEVQQASLFLGDPADENTWVRFRGVSTEGSLYVLWVVDDVEFHALGEEPSQAPVIRQQKRQARANINKALASMPLYREFTPAQGARKAPRQVPESEWLNNGQTTWQVSRDGEPLFNYIKTRHYTDSEAKDEGLYTYSVAAWTEADDYVHASADVDVEVTAFDYKQPTNVVAHATPSTGGKWDVSLTWEDPVTDGSVPAQYTIYINDTLLGVMPYGEEYNLGQILYPGIYEFSITADYTKPEGSSEPVKARVAAGTHYDPENLQAQVEGSQVALTWTAPAGEDTPSAYQVFRGDKLLADACTDLAYTDTDVPDGLYLYSVHAVYADGSSLPATLKVQVGENAPVALPLDQKFAGHLPADWNLVKVDPLEKLKDMYLWRFDNWFGMTHPGQDGALISGIAAGMSRVEAHLVSPAFIASKNTSVSCETWYKDEAPGPLGAAIYRVQISEDGENWTDFMELSTPSEGVKTTEASLAAYEGKKVQLRWGFVSRKSGEAALYRVHITDDTAVDSIDAITDSSAEVFTLTGLRLGSDLRNLPAGCYLVKTAKGTRKVLVK